MAVLEKEVRLNFIDSTNEIQFMSDVKEALAQLCKRTTSGMLETIPKKYTVEHIWAAFFDLAANFHDFVAQHILYEKDMLMTNPRYEYFSDLMLK